tara:strand:- start:34 stop:408 length:375 start_codon:yes stop_codon:yes gene_type:complete
MAGHALAPILSPSVRKGGYRLVETYSLILTPVERYIPEIKAGFTFDGASIPTFTGLTWALTYSPFDPIVMRAALLHDYLCVMQPAQITPKMAAQAFRTMLIEDGAAPWKANLMYRAILLAGPKW